MSDEDKLQGEWIRDDLTETLVFSGAVLQWTSMGRVYSYIWAVCDGLLCVVREPWGDDNYEPTVRILVDWHGDDSFTLASTYHRVKK